MNHPNSAIQLFYASPVQLAAAFQQNLNYIESLAKGIADMNIPAERRHYYTVARAALLVANIEILDHINMFPEHYSMSAHTLAVEAILKAKEGPADATA